MTMLLIALGAAVGAPTRYLTDRAIRSRHDTAFPWGTLVVNVVASFVLGLVVGADPGARWTALIGTGFCGAFSTYSTFSWDTLVLGRAGLRAAPLANVLLSLAAGLGAAALGWSLGRSF